MVALLAAHYVDQNVFYKKIIKIVIKQTILSLLLEDLEIKIINLLLRDAYTEIEESILIGYIMKKHIIIALE